MKLALLTLLTLLTFVGCGGSNKSSNKSTDSNKSFANKDLYHFNLNFVDSRQRYDLQKIDSIDAQMSYKYFDFESKDYIVDTKEQKLFVNGKTNALSEMQYDLDNDGALKATVDGKEVFLLSLLKKSAVERNRLDEYGSNITFKGTQYESNLTYLSNVHTVKDLVSEEAFDNLTGFVSAYKEKNFEGSSFNGLRFGENNELQQYTEGNLSQAGSYEIKTLDKKEILFLKALNVERYGSNTCYILDFSRVWKAECHLKNSSEKINFYDQEVYDAVLKYMQTAFVNVDISI